MTFTDLKDAALTELPSSQQIINTFDGWEERFPLRPRVLSVAKMLQCQEEAVADLGSPEDHGKPLPGVAACTASRILNDLSEVILVFICFLFSLSPGICKA